MASSTDICNLALGHLGVSTSIANLETEKSAEARACRRFFTTVRDATLRDSAWPFAKKTAGAQLVTLDPTTDWKYAYRYPSDCINMRRIVNRAGVDAPAIPYEMGQDSGGELIFTNYEAATLEYTQRIEDTQRYTPDFVLALSLHLGMLIAPAVTGGDPYKLGQDCERKYQYYSTKAQAQSRNEEQKPPNPKSEFEAARE